jgi:hypothetical protein
VIQKAKRQKEERGKKEIDLEDKGVRRGYLIELMIN